MNPYRFIPFDSFTLITKLSTMEVRSRIVKNVEPKRFFRLSFFNNNKTKPYEGELVGSNFSINRIINYRNSSLPIIKGHISSEMGQTKVTVIMRLMIAPMIFMTCWLGAVGVACVYSLIRVIRDGFNPVIFAVFGMFVLVYVAVTLFFKFESKKSKKFLLKLLEAEDPKASSIAKEY